MSELGQLSVAPEVKKAVGPDVVKVGDSERRRPETSRAMNMVGATMEFLGDLGKANLTAKRELGEMASTRIGKAIAVGVVGTGLELASESALKLALQTLTPLLPTQKNSLEAIKKILDHPFAQELIEDVGVYALYNKGNELIGGDLPKVPSSYLGMTTAVDVLDWSAHHRLGPEKRSKFSSEIKKVKGKGKGKFALEFNTKDADEVPGLIPSWVGKIANFSNPVTLFGASQVVEGASAYIRAVREIRNARKIGGEKKVESLIAEAKKAKPMGAKPDKQERILNVLEKAA